MSGPRVAYIRDGLPRQQTLATWAIAGPFASFKSFKAGSRANRWFAPGAKVPSGWGLHHYSRHLTD